MDEGMRKTGHSMRHGLTLIELIVGMALLLIVVSTMALMLWSAQGVVSGSSERDSLFNDAHTALNVMTRDLKSSIYDGEKIFFWHRNDREINFVAVDSHAAPLDSCNISEIRYRHDVSDMTLKRSSTGSVDSQWDFYGNPSTAAWSNDDYQTLMKHVTDLKITCLDSMGNELTSSSTDFTQYPHYVRIELSALPRESFNRWRESGLDSIRDNDERKFTAIVRTGGR